LICLFLFIYLLLIFDIEYIRHSVFVLGSLFLFCVGSLKILNHPISLHFFC